jgi:hypothetical protein
VIQKIYLRKLRLRHIWVGMRLLNINNKINQLALNIRRKSA